MEVVYRVPDQFYTRHSHHYGSRIVFDREGYLYLAIGDRGQRPLAQNVKLPHGTPKPVAKVSTRKVCSSDWTICWAALSPATARRQSNQTQ